MKNPKYGGPKRIKPLLPRNPLGVRKKQKNGPTKRTT